MFLTSEKCNPPFVPLGTLIAAALVLIPALSLASEPAGAIGKSEEICMPKGTYPMADGGTTVFSHDSTCFRPAATRIYPWERKISRATMSPPDPYNGARVVRYDYHDALYHCTHLHMRLPTVEELKALFAYANKANNAAMGSRYAIVAGEGDSRFSGGVYGWGGGSVYWSNTFAGTGHRKVVDLGTGRVGISRDSQLNYVSCAR